MRTFANRLRKCVNRCEPDGELSRICRESVANFCESVANLRELRRGLSRICRECAQTEARTFANLSRIYRESARICCKPCNIRVKSPSRHPWISAGAARAHLRRREARPRLEQPSESAAGQLDLLDRPTCCNASWRFSIVSEARAACEEHVRRTAARQAAAQGRHFAVGSRSFVRSPFTLGTQHVARCGVAARRAWRAQH